MENNIGFDVFVVDFRERCVPSFIDLWLKLLAWPGASTVAFFLRLRYPALLDDNCGITWKTSKSSCICINS